MGCKSLIDAAKKFVLIMADGSLAVIVVHLVSELNVGFGVGMLFILVWILTEE